jgi:cardiolipin synthase
MFNHLQKIPNRITAIRLLALPVLWILALTGARTYLAIGLLLSAITDVIDGPIARKYNQTSDFGSKFDSLADQLIQISAVFWVLILMPEVYTDNLWITIAAVGTYLASLTVGLIKFKRLANLHLYLTKLGGIFLYTFVIHAFLFGQYNRGLYLVAVLFLLLSHAECLFLQLTSSEVNAHSGSILFRYLERDHPLRYWLSRLP